MITQERLKELFVYGDGELVRRVSVSSNAKAGDIAGSLHSDGYTRIFVDNKIYLAHRLIWLYHYGYLPKYLDHKYGKENGDYLWNLRSCTSSQNQHNSNIYINNTSGFKGVSWHKPSGKWRARIMANGSWDCLGLFYDKEVAAQVIRIERLKIHGEFANHG